MRRNKKQSIGENKFIIRVTDSNNNTNAKKENESKNRKWVKYSRVYYSNDFIWFFFSYKI